MTRTVRRFGLGIGAAVMALGLAAAVLASPQNNPGPGGPGGFMGPRGGRMGGPMMGGPMAPLAGLRMLTDRLGLTDAQKTQVKSIVESHRAAWKALADRAFQAHQALNAAIDADTVDEGAIRSAAAGVAAVDADMAVARAHARAEIFQVLTPDQQAQAKQLQAQRQQRMDQMRQRMQNRPGRP